MVLIDKMTSEDISGVFIVEEECFSKPWSYQAFADELKNENSVSFVAIDEHEVVGFINSHFILDEGYINNVAVTLTHRRKGVADLLIKKLIKEAKEKKLSFLTLEVRVSNEAAIELYTKNGFIKVGERKNFYEAPIEDAILMTLEFN